MWRVCLVFVGACSFAFMPPPSSVGARGCNDGFEAPVTDTIVGGAAFAGAASLGAIALTHPTGAGELPALLVTLVTMGLLYGSSAVYGYLSRDHSKRLREELRRDQTARNSSAL